MKQENIIKNEFDIKNQEQFKNKLKPIINEIFPESPPLAFVHSFGCQQNVSDGEKIKGILASLGYGFSNNQDDADLIIYNTCAVRENAESKVFGNIGELKHLKAKKSSLIIAICGCMAQQEHVCEKIKKTYLQVDLVFGTNAFYQLPEMLFEIFSSHNRLFKTSDSDNEIIENVDIFREDKIKASVPIMNGCNNFCTYCIVPYVRGRETSRKPEGILNEIRELINEGYKEITLLGQNVNSYSYDFPNLLREINKISGDFRIRFMSSHPKDASFELIDTILECEKVCNHLHLPVQAGSNKILNAMNRRYNTEDYLKIVKYARAKKSDFSFTSDIIVGFPGESYEDFLETKKLITEVRFDNLYTFVYSKRTGTKAAEFVDNISDNEKGKWLRELILYQREISTANFKRFLGKTVIVLCEGEGRSDSSYLTGKNEESIIVEFKAEPENIGKFVKVKILKAMNWALLGEIVK